MQLESKSNEVQQLEILECHLHSNVDLLVVYHLVPVSEQSWKFNLNHFKSTWINWFNINVDSIIEHDEECSLKFNDWTL